MSDRIADLLLIEDNPNEVELILRSFGRHAPGIKVRVARDALEVRQALFGNTGEGHFPLDEPRVIVLDLKLLRISGLQLLQEIKTHPRLRAVPVVILTSSQEPRDLADSYRLGANSYVVKPVDYDRFTEVLGRLITYWLQVNEVAVT